MKLTIRYKRDKNDSGYINDRSFDVDFAEGIKREEILKELDLIRDDHAGFLSDSYFFAPEAEGISCQLDGEDGACREYGFDPEEKKIEPLIFADGLIRRLRADKLTITDENNKYIFTDPSIDEADPGYLKAGGYVYQGRRVTDRIAVDEESEEFFHEIYLELKSVKAFLLFRDIKESMFYNIMYYPGSVPYFFILRGERGRGRLVYDYMYNEETEELEELSATFSELNYKLYLDVLKRICIGNRMIPVISGQLDYEQCGVSRFIQGIFVGNDGRSYPDMDYSGRQICCVSGLIPIMMLGRSIENKKHKDDFVVNTDIEGWIDKGELKIADVDREYKVDICRQLNNSLMEYGLCLSSRLKYVDKAGVKGEGCTSFSKKQSEELLEWFYKKYHDWYENDAVGREIEYAMSKAGRSAGTTDIPDEKKKKEIIRLIREYDDSCEAAQDPVQAAGSKYRTAIHETGHAVIGKIQHKGEVVSGIVSVIGRKGKYGGVCTIGCDERDPSMECHERDIRNCLGSRAAEEMFFGAASKGWRKDYKQAGLNIVWCIREWGEFYYSGRRLMCRLPGDRPPVRVGTAIDELTERYMKETKTMLADREELIRYLACMLLAEGEIDAKRFNWLYNGYYETREEQKLLSRMRLALNTVRAIPRGTWKDDGSLELLGELSGERSNIWMPEKSEKYSGCEAGRYISLILGFDPFAEDYRKQMAAAYPKLSERASRRGSLRVVTEEKGQLSAFLDY